LLGRAIQSAASTLTSRAEQAKGVKNTRVDDMSGDPRRSQERRACPVTVDLTRDENCCLRAGFLSVEVTVTIEHDALAPFRGYAHAI
jgi:hypothetical protein